jgi:dienelactone hydrolase
MPNPLRELSFSVENARGDAVHGDVRFVEDGAVKPAVVFCHGFKGFKDWGPFPEWGRYLARSGFVAVHFNFSYNGVTPDAPTEFTDLEAFAENTYTRELDDVDAVLDAVAGDALPQAPVDPDRIGLMGHSRGGGIAILQAERDERVRALATWSAVSGFAERFSQEQIRDWETQGYTEVLNSRTGQVMRLNKVLYDDTMEHRDRLDVRAAAERMDTPWLLVHARDDESVSFDEARLLDGLSDAATLVEAEGGHTFGGAHPHDSDDRIPDSLQFVWDRTVAFFDDELS